MGDDDRLPVKFICSNVWQPYSGIGESGDRSLPSSHKHNGSGESGLSLTNNSDRQMSEYSTSDARDTVDDDRLPVKFICSNVWQPYSGIGESGDRGLPSSHKHNGSGESILPSWNNSSR